MAKAKQIFEGHYEYLGFTITKKFGEWYIAAASHHVAQRNTLGDAEKYIRLLRSGEELSPANASLVRIADKVLAGEIDSLSGHVASTAWDVGHSNSDCLTPVVCYGLSLGELAQWLKHNRDALDQDRLQKIFDQAYDIIKDRHRAEGRS